MTRSVRSLVFGLALVAATAALAAAHDMFLKPAQFFIPENAPLDMVLLNGTLPGEKKKPKVRRLNCTWKQKLSVLKSTGNLLAFFQYKR